MNIAERIKKAQEELVKKKDDLVAATTALEAEPDEEALVVQVEQLSAEVETMGKHLQALQKAEKALAEKRAVEDAVGAPAIVPRRNDGQAKPGERIFQMAAVRFIAYAEKKSVEQVLEERYKGNDALKAVLDWSKKTAVNPAMTGTAGWAAELVRTDVRGFLESLEAVSVAAALATRSMQLNFDGYNSITVPRMNPLAATPTEPAWVAEGGAIPLTQFSFGSTVLNRYKLAAITTMSMELVERSTPQIESVLSGALRKAYAKVLDNALLSNVAAVANVRPAGLLNGVTVNAGDATGGMPSVIADMKTLVGALMANNLGERPVLLMNNQDRLGLSMLASPLGEMTFRDELSSGRLMGIEVISSGNVPQGTVIMIDAGTLATAFDVPMFDIDRVATVVEANADGTAPTMADNAGTGAVGTAGQVNTGIGVVPTAAVAAGAGAGYTARSLWQTYSEGIRMIAPTSWALMRPNSVAALNQLAW